MTISATDSHELIAIDRSSDKGESLDLKELDQLVKDGEYLKFLEAVESFDIEKRGMKTLLATKIRKLNIEEVAKDAALIAKLTTTLAEKHASLMDKQVMQRGLINKLQRAIKHENVIAQLVSLELIDLIGEQSLEEKLSKTKDEQTVNLIRAFKELKNEKIEFTVNSDLTITVTPRQVSTAQLLKIQNFISTYSWNNIRLNLQCYKGCEEASNDELKRILMIIQKDSSSCVSLSLEGHPLSKGIIKDLVALIGSAPSIKELNLANCKISSDRLKSFVKIWDKKNDPLTKLSLAENPLGDKGIKLLLEKISTKSQLTSLNLESTEIQTEGVTEITQHLISRKPPLILKLSESEIKEDAREFISFMCTPSTVEFVKATVEPLETTEPLFADKLDEIVESIFEGELVEKEYYAKVYDGKTATLRDATTKDLDTFDAIYLPERNAVEADFTSDVLDQPNGIVMTISSQGLPKENFRILIDEKGIMIISYWTTYVDTSNGYEIHHEWYYEDMDFTDIVLKPETFTFDELDETTFAICVDTKK